MAFFKRYLVALGAAMLAAIPIGLMYAWVNLSIGWVYGFAAVVGIAALVYTYVPVWRGEMEMPSLTRRRRPTA